MQNIETCVHYSVIPVHVEQKPQNQNKTNLHQRIEKVGQRVVGKSEHIATKIQERRERTYCLQAKKAAGSIGEEIDRSKDKAAK